MLAPRSFLFSREHKSKSSDSLNTKHRPSQANTRATHESPSNDPVEIKQCPRESEKPAIMSIMTISSHSQPVVIPRSIPSPKDAKQHEKRASRQHIGRTSHGHHASRAKDVHSPAAIPSSVAALLATTAIPQRRRSMKCKITPPNQRLTVDAILQHNIQGNEIDCQRSKSHHSLDFLLGNSDDDADLDTIASDLGNGSYLSNRSMSTDSVPSLAEISTWNSAVSLSSPATPSTRSSPSPSPRRRSFQSISSPPRECALDHPLSAIVDLQVEQLDFSDFVSGSRKKRNSTVSLVSTPNRRSVFKSNLTASLKALKAAAISFSNSMATPTLTPDDFLTRSIIAIDPRVPFTDERMPPRLENTPTPALRRYLNPTHGPTDTQLSGPASTACTASIQMQTYKSSKSGRSQASRPSSRKTASSNATTVAPISGPVTRQREMRENSDFIRVAVMEMLMRKNGKLDDSVPGHAKWALPPRQTLVKDYPIGDGGIPARWIAINA